MSVTNKTHEGFQKAGNQIVGKDFKTLGDKSAFMAYRRKPIPALFSRKALNLEYTTDSLFKPLKEMNITEHNGFDMGKTYRTMDMKTIETNYDTNEMGTTGLSIMRYGSCNPTTRAAKQPTK